MNNAMARKLNLLIVDDDPSMVRLLSHMVERNLSDKMTVHGLSDSNEALRWLDQHCCDILISDINMPDTDGLEMLRFAKARNAWTQVMDTEDIDHPFPNTLAGESVIVGGRALKLLCDRSQASEKPVLPPPAATS